MKFTFLTGFLALALSCGTKTTKSPEIITPVETEPEVIEVPVEIIEVEPVLPDGAVTANFKTNAPPFYAVIDRVDKNKGTTVISFEQESVPNISIPGAYGASLETVRFPEFDRDLLLVRTIYKDPIFRKYYLYVYRSNQWKKVVDGFILHVDNIQEDVIPIKVNPKNPKQMLRKYSVFDLDTEGATKFRWILHKETTPILNW